MMLVVAVSVNQESLGTSVIGVKTTTLTLDKRDAGNL